MTHYYTNGDATGENERKSYAWDLHQPVYVRICRYHKRGKLTEHEAAYLTGRTVEQFRCLYESLKDEAIKDD